MPYYDNFWHIDTHENIPPPACLIVFVKLKTENQLRGKLSAVAGHHSFFRAVRSWSVRLSALIDSDLAWVNGKSGR